MNNQAITRKLMGMKEKIEQAKTEKSQLEGRVIELQERLEEEHGCNTLSEAEKKITKLNNQIKKQEEELSIRLKKLGTQYDW